MPPSPRSSTSNTAAADGPAHVRPARRRIALRALLLLAMACVLAAVCLGIAVWWSDRPLRAIESHLQQEEFDQALALSKEFLREHPGDLRAEVLQARAYVGQRRFEEADRLFSGIVHSLGGLPPTEPNLRAYADTLLYFQRWSDAEAVLGQLLELSDDDADALYKLTVARTRMGKFEAALRSARRYAALPGHEGEGYVLIATIHHDTGRLADAVAAWEKVVAANPKCEGLKLSPGEALFMFGRALLSAGKAQRAVQILERSVSLREAGEAYAALGTAYLQVGRSADAERAWKRALDFDADDVEAREQLANAALRRRRPAEAADWMQPLVSRGTLRSSGAYLLQRAATMRKDAEAAEQWRKRAESLRKAEKLKGTIDQMLRDFPDSFWSRFVRAHRFARAGNLHEARALVNELLRQDPDEPLLKELAAALRGAGPLPSLQRLPITTVE